MTPPAHRDLIERSTPNGFTHHILHHHNVWHYLYAMAYVQLKPRTELTGLEAYVLGKIETKDVSFFPLNRALALEDRGGASRAAAAAAAAGSDAGGGGGGGGGAGGLGVTLEGVKLEVRELFATETATEEGLVTKAADLVQWLHARKGAARAPRKASVI